MSVSDDYEIVPYRAKFTTNEFGLALNRPDRLILQFQNNKVSVRWRKLTEVFFLKKFVINRNPTTKEYHIRTDGLSIYLSREEECLMDIMEGKIRDLNGGNATSSSTVRPPSTKVVAPVPPRMGSPDVKGKLNMHGKTSGTISRTTTVATNGKHQSPQRLMSSVQQRVYTQSPLKSPLKSLPPVDEASLANNRSLAHAVSSSSTHVVPQVTYGRNSKRQYSALNGIGDKHSAWEAVADLAYKRRDEDEDEGDRGIDNPVPIAPSDTKVLVPARLDNFFRAKPAEISMSTPPRSEVRPSQPMWNTLTSTLSVSENIQPRIVDGNVGKQARMRLSGSPLSSAMANEMAAGLRTPEKSKPFGSLTESLGFANSRPRPALIEPFSLSGSSLFANPIAPAVPSVVRFDGKYEGGIRNLGNTCYMSSILQALSSVRGLSANLNSTLWQTVYHHDSLISSSSVALQASDAATGEYFSSPAAIPTDLQGRKQFVDRSLFLQLSNMLQLIEVKRNHPINSDQLTALINSTNGGYGGPLGGSHSSKVDTMLKIERKFAVDPMRFRACVIHRQEKFANFSQQDAQEFLSDLMNELEDDMFRTLRGVILQQKMKVVHDKSRILNTPSPATISAVPATIAAAAGAAAESSTGDSISMDANGHTDGPSLDAIDSKVSLTSEAVQEISGQVDAQMQLLKQLFPPSLFFESSMQSVMTCINCHHQREPRTEMYRDFSLEVDATDDAAPSSPVAANNDIHYLIHRYLQPESRDLRCQHCEVGEQVEMRKQLLSVAPVLVFHLKRFQYDRRLQEFRKIDAPVTFPSKLSLRAAGMMNSNVPNPSLEAKAQVVNSSSFKRIFTDSAVNTIDAAVEKFEACTRLAKDLSEGRVAKGMLAFTRIEDSEYQLTAVVRHYGSSIGGGHYVCDVRNHKVGHGHEAHWLRYNDTIVTPISEEAVLGEKDTPYVLFYQKLTC